jgi:hypothetical protein
MSLCFNDRRTASKFVMAGLDPAIHPSAMNAFGDGLPGFRRAGGATAPQAGQARQ